MPARAALPRFVVPIALLAAGWCVSRLAPHRWDAAGFLTLGFVFAVYIACVAKGGWRNAAAVAASVLVCLVAAEIYAIPGLPAVIETRSPGEQVADPVLGWRPQHPGVFNHKKIDARTGRVIFDVDYTIDAQLNRLVVSAPSGPTIAFFGDSLTFGHGIPDADTLPQLFADEIGRSMRVLNLAIAGSGPQLFLRALETDIYEPELSQSRAFIYLTAPWHAQRTACADGHTQSPRYVLVDSRPVFEGACDAYWPVMLRELYRNSAAYQTFVEPILGGPNKDWIDLYVAILVRAGQLARAKYGVPTIILYAPDAPYLHYSGYTDEEIIQRLRDGGLVVVADVRIDPATFPGQPLGIPGDSHPTRVTNGVRANLLVKTLDGLGLISRHP